MQTFMLYTCKKLIILIFQQEHPERVKDILSPVSAEGESGKRETDPGYL